MSDDEDKNNDTLRETTNEILSNLDPGEEKILREKFGIDASGDMNLQETGKQFDITRDRIKAFKEKALNKIKTRKQHIEKNSKSCSFCKKSHNKVNKIIETDAGVTICNECVILCNELINGQDNK